MASQLRAFGVIVLGLMAGASLLASAQTRTDLQRTVYVTATDPKGTPIGDLTAADFSVKDGGKEREILSVVWSKERLKVAVAVDELLVEDILVRQSLLRLIQQLRESGEIALYLVGRRNEKRVDYSTDITLFLNAINAFPTRAQYQGALVESIFEIAAAQKSLEGRRVIITLAPEFPQLSNVTSQGVLDQLRDHGIIFYAATLTGASSTIGGLQEAPASRLEGGDMTSLLERDRLLGDGPKQSGGLRLGSNRVEGFPGALDRIAADLLHQYAVTYVIPAGTKSDGRVSIATKRKGITVRGPTLVPKV